MKESFLTIDHRVDPELRDPICGMVVDETRSAGRRELRGRVYLFCSDACRRQFDTIVGLRAAMAAPEVDAVPGPPVAGELVAVRVQAVAKTYVTYGLWPLVRRTPVLVDASLEVARGDIAAIVGGNGSGKSTLMNIVAGVLDRDAGTVEITGRLGHCPQHPVLYEKLTVAETFRLFGVAYGMDPLQVGLRKADLMEQLDFGRFDDFRVDQLSGGTRQKLSLGLALLHDPDVLLLDEPYSGFDYETYLRFWELSEGLASKGRAIVVVSHFVQQRERFTRIYRVKDGRCERER
ncbi:MAG TPA: ATP-binding cassette domain-containing protein [Acidimicrobiia bacterium]